MNQWEQLVGTMKVADFCELAGITVEHVAQRVMGAPEPLTIAQRITSLVRGGGCLALREIQSSLGGSANSVQVEAARMVKAGTLVRVSRGVYSAP